MGKRATPDTTQQKRALDYERKMLRATANTLASGVASSTLIKNALIESFLIHARLLIEFLYRAGQKGNIQPKDLCDPKEWGKIRGGESALLARTRKDANKYLAHLTKTRLGEKKEWPVQEIAREIDLILKKFYELMNTPQNGTAGTAEQNCSR